MSANSNTESMFAKSEQFHNRVPPSEPLTTKGHKPGVKVGKDAVPEFQAETLPAGTAPPEKTYQPRPNEFQSDPDVPAIPVMDFHDVSAEGGVESQNPAAASLGGATSADVNAGFGKPMSGQTSRELRGTEKKQRAGLEGVGANPKHNEDVFNTTRAKGADLPDGVEKGMRQGGYEGAENMPNVTAEHLAAERKVPARAYDYTQGNAGK